MITACREPDRAAGELMTALMEAVIDAGPATPVELRRLGRTLKQRATDVLAYFDRPGANNGPTEAINCRLELHHLGFRNFTNCIA